MASNKFDSISLAMQLESPLLCSMRALVVASASELISDPQNVGKSMIGDSVYARIC